MFPKWFVVFSAMIIVSMQIATCSVGIHGRNQCDQLAAGVSSSAPDVKHAIFIILLVFGCMQFVQLSTVSAITMRRGAMKTTKSAMLVFASIVAILTGALAITKSDDCSDANNTSVQTMHGMGIATTVLGAAMFLAHSMGLLSELRSFEFPLDLDQKNLK